MDAHQGRLASLIGKAGDCVYDVVAACVLCVERVHLENKRETGEDEGIDRLLNIKS